MRIDEAKIALKVANCKSFSLAAEQLGLVNSKVTRVITNLEEEYGHAIFSRTTRKMEVTPYGEVFLRHAQRMVSQDDHLRHELQALSDGQVGTIELGYSGNVMSDILPMVVKHTLANMPAIQITPRFAWAQEIARNLKEGNVDVGFVSNFAPVPELEYFHFANKEVFFVVPENHRLADRDYVVFEDVADEGFIVGPYRKWRSQRMMLDSYFGQHNRPYNIAFVTDDPVSMEVMVQLGLGIGLNYELPDTVLRPGLVRLPVKDVETKIPVYVQWRMSNSNPAVRPFLGMLEEMKEQFL
jgi:DNA-binding transcriptional LysR family regulator